MNEEPIDFIDIPDTDFSLAQLVRSTITAFRSVREDRQLSREEWRAQDALNKLWTTYTFERQHMVLDVLEYAKRGFASAIACGIIMTASPAFADTGFHAGVYPTPTETVELRPAKEPTEIFALVDNEPKAIEGLQKVDRPKRKHFWSLPGKKQYHYKLKDTKKELVLPQRLNCQDLRPFEEQHPLKTAGIKFRDKCEFWSPIVGIGTQVVIWYGQLAAR